MAPWFIALEGIDGSGKSTLAKRLADHLGAYHTKEETDSWLGAAVLRSIREGMDPYATLYLFVADRIQHQHEIQAQLDQGTPVVCDRYLGSTYAYQGAALEGTPNVETLIDALHGPVTVRPDATILLDLDVDVALERIASRGAAQPYEKQAFLTKVQSNYRDQAVKEGWLVVDASKDEASVFEQAVRLLHGKGILEDPSSNP